MTSNRWILWSVEGDGGKLYQREKLCAIFSTRAAARRFVKSSTNGKGTTVNKVWLIDYDEAIRDGYMTNQLSGGLGK